MLKRLLVGLLVLLLGILVALPVLADDHPADQPLMVAVDMGFVPFAFLDANGNPSGLAVDLATQIAIRLGRPSVQIVDIQWAGIFAGLFAKKVEFIVAPTDITKDRAAQMDFTEPYMDTAELIAINVKNKDTIKTVADLQGKTIGVNTGSSGDIWLHDNQAKYGFKIDEYDRMPDAMMAVQAGRTDGAIGDVEAIAYYIKDQPDFIGAILVPTGDQYGLPFRQGDPFRDQVEQVLEGMKLDGSFASIYEKWLGSAPPLGSSSTIVYAGYGPFGMPGFKLTYHTTR